MTAYIIRRLLLLPVILFGVTLLVFGVYSFLDPREKASLYVRDVPRAPDALQRIIHKYGLDAPFHIQYWRWLNQVFRGNLGWSKSAQRPVLEAILYYFPATAELVLWATIPILFIGIWLGILAAAHHNRPVDHMSRVFALVGWSFPSYVFGLLFIMIFYAMLHWLPPGRVSDWVIREINAGTFREITRIYTIDAIINGRPDVLANVFKHMILPVLTLSYIQWALLLRVTRSSMLETLRQEYIMTARSKGLAERVVVYKHAVRNALIPVITMGGMLLIGLLNGAVITETVFNYRGMGWWAVNAAIYLDIYGLLGLTLFNGVLLSLAILVIDILYAVIDPRIRLE